MENCSVLAQVIIDHGLVGPEVVASDLVSFLVSFIECNRDASELERVGLPKKGMGNDARLDFERNKGINLRNAQSRGRHLVQSGQIGKSDLIKWMSSKLIYMRTKVANCAKRTLKRLAPEQGAAGAAAQPSLQSSRLAAAGRAPAAKPAAAAKSGGGGGLFAIFGGGGGGGGGAATKKPAGGAGGLVSPRSPQSAKPKPTAAAKPKVRAVSVYAQALQFTSEAMCMWSPSSVPRS